MKYVGVKTTGELRLHEVKEPQTDEIYMAVEDDKLGAVPIRPYEFVKWDGKQWVKVPNVQLATTLDISNVETLLATLPSGGLVNIGGKTYRTVTIGGVTWLAQNLDFKFSGCEIGATGSPTTPAAWYYNNDEATYGLDGTYKCGLLYNWHAVKYLNDNRDTLIPGWHVASNAEWDALATAVGGNSTAGTKLKAKDNTVTSNWPSGWGGTDDYGFNALPAGNRGSVSFNDLGSNAYCWTASEYSSTNAYYRYFSTGASMGSGNYNKSLGYSVRLVKDS